MFDAAEPLVSKFQSFEIGGKGSGIFSNERSFLY